MGYVAGTPALTKDVNPSKDIVDDLTGFVDLVFNGVSITLARTGSVNTPQYLQYFEMKRMVNGIGFFTITLVDPEWVRVENLILNSAKEGNTVLLRYGMLGLSGNRNVLPLMKVKVLKYELDPYIDYSVITIRGLCLGYGLLAASLVGTNAKIKTVLEGGLSVRDTSSISTYVDNLATTLGFTTAASKNITPTSTPLLLEDLGTSSELAGIKAADNASILGFLIEKLVTKANSAENDKSPYVFFVSRVKDASTPEIQERFNFCRINATVASEPRVSYTLFSDRESRVLSFKPSYSNSIVNIAQGNTVLAYGYDSFTGEEFGKVAGGAVIASLTKQDPSSITVTPRVIQYIPGPAEYVSQRLNVVAANLAMSPITAELTVVGDVGFDILDCVDIFVNIPSGPTEIKGSPHNTSGRYIILGIVDKIDAGVFETSLHLGSGFQFTPVGKSAAQAAGGPTSVSQAEEALPRATPAQPETLNPAAMNSFTVKDYGL